MAEKEKIYYEITFRDAKTQEMQTLKAKKVEDSNLGLSFISISEFIFEQSPLLLDPLEEKLKKKFAHTKRLHISIYNILSIEEIGEENRGLHFNQDKSKIVVLRPESPSS